MSLAELMKQAQANESAETQQRKVEVYFLITRIGEIDTMNEKFLAEIRIESRYLLLLVYFKSPLRLQF